MAQSDTLNSCQLRALESLQGIGNVFLTGVAGSGKSYLIRQFLRSTILDIPVLASTGAAAILVGGRTFHSFFGLGIMQGGYEATVARALENKRVVKRLKKVPAVIIDEVSMLSGTTLRAAEEITRTARDSDEPWGGLRVIAVGDFAQLPPVMPYGSGSRRDWAFIDAVWPMSQFIPEMLETQVRTQDPDFLRVLNYVREGVANREVGEYLNSRRVSPEESLNFEGTRLFPHRETVERFNLERLERLPRVAVEFPTEYFGDAKAVEDLKRNAPIPELLKIKEGALVMLRQNDPALRWVNGSLAQVEQILITQKKLKLLLLDSGRSVELEPASFTILDAEGQEVAAAHNFPINLAYATTIHKAQGMTLDRVMIDLRNLWEPGQAYVALSRVKSGSGLFLTAWTPSSIRMDAEVARFYRSFRPTLAQAAQPWQIG